MALKSCWCLRSVVGLFCSWKCCGVLRFARPILWLGRLAVAVSRAVVWDLWRWLDLARSFCPRTPVPGLMLLSRQEKGLVTEKHKLWGTWSALQRIEVCREAGNGCSDVFLIRGTCERPSWGLAKFTTSSLKRFPESPYRPQVVFLQRAVVLKCKPGGSGGRSPCLWALFWKVGWGQRQLSQAGVRSLARLVCVH